MKAITHLKKGVSLTKNFGLPFGILYIIEKLKVGTLSKKCMQYRIRITKKWLNKKYGYFLNEKNNSQLNNQKKVWVYWGQGYENAPELVQACINSIKKNINAELIIVTNDNFKEYVNIDRIILEKFEAGVITYTHFSDILRCELLYTYGGLWFDSTVLVTNFYSDIWNYKFWTIRRQVNRSIGSISYYRWNNAILKGDSSIYYYMSLLFKAYWKENNEMIDYFLIDYFMDLIYDLCPACRLLIDNVPFNNDKEFELMKIINNEYSVDAFNNLVSNCFIHKLQRRSSFDKISKDGKETFYSVILDKYFI